MINTFLSIVAEDHVIYYVLVWLSQKVAKGPKDIIFGSLDPWRLV